MDAISFFMSMRCLSCYTHIAMETGLTGFINGNSLITDSVSGFLVQDPNAKATTFISGGVRPPPLFSPEKKILFLTHLKKLFPDYTKCSKLVGVSRGTFKNHYELDEHFRNLVDEIAEEHVDQVERVRFKVAKQGKGSFDRMCLLNAWRSERYMTKAKIEIEHKMLPQEAQARARVLGDVVDAEVVEVVKRLKKSNEFRGPRPE